MCWWYVLDVCNALRVRAAIDMESSDVACMGRLCCVNVCIKLFGIAFHGDCVMSCRVWCSLHETSARCSSVWDLLNFLWLGYRDVLL